MFKLTIWDLAIVALYVVFCLSVAFALKKRGERHGLKSYILSDRNMPWWILGTSMVATTFSAETPLLVSAWVFESGISRNWEWWCFLPGAMLTTFFFARLWRRTEVLTDAEYITLRYSGKEAHVLRAFRALYMGFIVNGIILGSQFLVCGLIGTTILGIDNTHPHYTAWRIGIPLCCAFVAAMSSALAGISGILITDFVMFILKLTAAIAVCIYAIKQPAVGGLANLTSQIASLRPAHLQFLPHPGLTQLTVTALALFLTIRWWSQVYGGAEPGGAAYVAQRMLAARDEKNALFATLWFNIAHYAVRPWPWILTGLACILIFPNATNGDIAYIRCIDFVPSGLKGLVLAGFLAALMAIDTRLNLGAAYMVNDLYRPYLNPNRSDKHYILISRLSIVLLIAAALIYSFWVTRVKSTFFVVTAIGSGSGLVYILRWYWWRVNAWSEIAAMIAAITSAAVFRLFIYPTESSFNANGLIVLAVSTAVVTFVWIATTLLTPPSNIEQLKHFYLKVRPAGPFWSPVARALSADNPRSTTAPSDQDNPRSTTARILDPGYSIPRSLVAWLSAIVMVYAILFGTGKLLLGHPLPGLLLLAIALIAVLILRVAWASRPCPQRDTGFQPVREPYEEQATTLKE